VTPADYERLARAAGPAAARVRCLPAGPGPGDPAGDPESGGAESEAGAVRVLIVPEAVADEGDRLRFEQLVPSAELLAAIAGHLDERRLIGTRLVVEPPYYQGVTVVAQVLTTGADADQVRHAAQDALYRYLNPLRGGADGAGWPFGRPVQLGEVFAVLQQVHGVALVEQLRLFPADPLTGRRGAQVDRVDLAPNALVFSYQHQLVVTPPGSAEPGGAA
jgi:predicted phage baseplate assembly protein